jgi:uroporphyrin-III C-methyltransferase
VSGFVWIVGAGPGDPELLTVRAARVLAAADVVAYDELVSADVLELVDARAETFSVGRRAGCPTPPALDSRIVAHARAGKRVVRLKGGDPHVFGRGGEEARVLHAEGIPFAIVPGVSAAFGAAASAGIPLTLRGVSARLTIATAHEAKDLEHARSFARTLPREGTIALYMGVAHLAILGEALVREGFPPEGPVAIVSRATLPDESVAVGTIAELGRLRAVAPAVLILGDVVAERVGAAAAPAARATFFASDACAPPPAAAPQP